MSGKKSDIQIRVELDNEMLPEKISWMAADSDVKTPSPCKAFMLSIFDEASSETLRIDLWTREMRQDEMDKFFFETFMTMADTYSRANKQDEVVNMIKEFAFGFGEKTGLIKRK